LEALEKAIQAFVARHLEPAKLFYWSHSAEKLERKPGLNSPMRVLGLVGICR